MQCGARNLRAMKPHRDARPGERARRRRTKDLRAVRVLSPPARIIAPPKEALDCGPARFRITNQTEGIADPSLRIFPIRGTVGLMANA